jgi:1-acyl-sn-glycerol-3-phosphate acyltransferase
MMKILARIILKLRNWKIVGEFPDELKKAVVIVAPHTSMWDFFWGRMIYFALGKEVKFLIKQEMFKFPLKGIVSGLGGIPVNRGKRNNMVDYVAGLFKARESLFITITPEATRKLNNSWKKGFYYIALNAKVPIVIGIIDYKAREIGNVGIFEPTGDFNKDFAYIETFYKGRGAKHPEKYNLS